MDGYSNEGLDGTTWAGGSGGDARFYSYDTTLLQSLNGGGVCLVVANQVNGDGSLLACGENSKNVHPNGHYAASGGAGGGLISVITLTKNNNILMNCSGGSNGGTKAGGGGTGMTVRGTIITGDFISL